MSDGGREWLTTAEVARILGVSERRVRQMARHLKARKQPDGLLLWPRTEVEAELRRRNEVEPSPSAYRPVAMILEEVLSELRAIRQELKDKRGKDAEDDGDGQGR